MCHNIIFVKCSAAAVAAAAAAIDTSLIPNTIPIRVAAVPTAEVIPTDRRSAVIQAEITSGGEGTCTSTDSTCYSISDGVVIVFVGHRVTAELQ